ncbi:hypothetical protein C5B86_11835 [Haloferax sp. Atlit-19N]|uniref:hypothetical protein n=1 Tax=Haloferax sp. Atlit-19N TaxID=2077201 RepID=UPI000E22F265|nr:hypothetical protein [Haloferax sp. Atlit-19N]RDZ43718.1 hypothetical protein C5B86_11835 [Haloferax sp. Atlit-19N]
MATKHTEHDSGIAERTPTGHEILVVTEWDDDGAPSLETLAQFDHGRRRNWRCVNCGEEQHAPSGFEENCPNRPV